MLLVAAWAGPAAAATPGQVLLRVTGTEQTDEVGSRVADAGDLDADGRADLLTVSQHEGVGMLVYGRTDGATVTMPSLRGPTPSPDGDTVIDGVGGARSWAPASAGDVNGDGRPDQLFGSAWLESAYVVYGRPRGSGQLNVLRDLTPDRGYRILGPGTGPLIDEFDDFGREVATIGDLNGDGRPDHAIGAPGYQSGAPGQRGSVFVVYGQAPGTAQVDLALLTPSLGFRIDAPAGCTLGEMIAPAGDANGDGVPDILVASRCGFDQGAAYVVFGRSDPVTGPINVETPGVGYRMAGTHAPTAVANAGDVNGDGLADAVIGAAYASPLGRTEAGVAHIVFGRAATDPVDLDALAPGSGYRIVGDAASSWTGLAVAYAGDVDHDGVPDVALGAPHGVPGGRVFIVRGRTGVTEIDLAARTEADGYVIAAPEDRSQAFGGVLATMGDVDGDGAVELAVGDVGYPRETEPGPQFDYGAAYVISVAQPAPVPPAPPAPPQPVAAIPLQATVAAVAAGPTLARRPWVTGRARVGAMLRCDVAWTNASVVRYTWLRGAKTIPGATAITYRPRRADAGKALRCRSVAESPLGRASATSPAVRVPRVCIVPSLIGVDLKVARARLKAKACRVGAVKIKRVAGRPNRVLRVTPSAGNLRPGGTKVDLVISRPRLKAKRA